MYRLAQYTVLLILLMVPLAALAESQGEPDRSIGLDLPATPSLQAARTSPHYLSAGAAGLGELSPSGSLAGTAPAVDSPMPGVGGGVAGDHVVFYHNAPHPVAPFPLVLNIGVRRYINEMLGQSGDVQAAFQRVEPYKPEMVWELEQRGLPRDLVYLAFAESGFSARGAGPWQLSRATARRFGLRVDGYVDERRDPVKSTRAAAEFLASLHDEIGDWRLTLASWNTGEGSIDRFWSLRGAAYDRLIKRLPRRTRSLLNRFMAVAFVARNAETYGLEPVEYSAPPYVRIKVRGGTALRRIAKSTGATTAMLRKLNPALLIDYAPPDVAGYEIWVPRVQHASARQPIDY